MTIRILDTTANTSWFTAKKTQSILAKPVSDLINPSILGNILLDTLEGAAAIHPENMVCVGQTGDVWQQAKTALVKKYSFERFDDAGWMVFSPKPENAVQCFELVGESIPETGYIIGAYGSKIDGFDNVQAFNKGDFICRQIDNHADQWVVRRGLFLNSYQIFGS